MTVRRSLLRNATVKRFLSMFFIGLALSGTIAACGNNNAGNKPSQPNEMTIVGYAVPKAAHDAIIAKFVEQWKQQSGQTVTIRQSYGGSGSQTRAIIDGLDADLTHLALAADTEKLVSVGKVSQDWTKQVPNNGIVARTVAAITVRPGNPKNIKSFEDLTRDDVKWVTPDPKTSGGARWNFIALWEYGLKKFNNDEGKTKDFVAKAYKNVAVLAKDAREATDAFAKQGQGDALITYENEAILAKQKGTQLDYVVPPLNISIDTPLAIVEESVNRKGNRPVVEAFAKYLFTPEAQAEFVKLGFRPIDRSKPEDPKQFPPVKTLATIQDFGGWTAVQEKFFEDGAIFDQIQPQR